MKKITFLIPAILMLAACAEKGNTEEQVKETPAAVIDERDEWQQPDELLALMGDLHGKTVADLFAADGYFTFQLIKAGANVIAIDNDPKNISIIEQKKEEAGLSDERLQIRSVAAGDPGVKPSEVDAALMVHSFTKISDRMAYLQKLREGLKEPKQLFLVEWQKRPTPVGPPQDQRIASEQVMEDLGMAGFSTVGARADRMPYQVILIAMDDISLSEEEYQRQMEGKEVHPL